jgi:hypothetical protein
MLTSKKTKSRERALRLAMLIGLCVGIGCLQPGQGQVLPENWSGGGAFYDLASPDAVKMQVHVWGTIRSPGIYQLPRDTKLSTLFTVAGGYAMQPLERGTRQQTTLRLLRPNGSGYDEVFSAELGRDISPLAFDPTLLSGDILTVETTMRRRVGAREVLSMAGSVASIAYLIVRLSRVL